MILFVIYFIDSCEYAFENFKKYVPDCCFQLLCSMLPQNGKQDSDGIMRFMPEDIRKETTRVLQRKNRIFYVRFGFDL